MNAALVKIRSSKRLPAPALGKAIRVAAGVTQGELADAIGVHRVTIARWESSSPTARRPRGELRRQYAQILADLNSEVGAE